MFETLQLSFLSYLALQLLQLFPLLIKFKLLLLQQLSLLTDLLFFVSNLRMAICQLLFGAWSVYGERLHGHT